MKKALFILGLALIGFLIYVLFMLMYSPNAPPSKPEKQDQDKSEEIVPPSPKIAEKPVIKFGKWELVWQDDFTSPEIDQTKWNVLNRKDSFNNELQYYLPQNVVQSGGELKLIAKKEWIDGKEFTSGLVDTKGKAEFRYGRLEIRAKYGKGKGLFPAIWLMPANGVSHLPEVDILEAIGSDPEKVYMVYHWLENGRQKTAYKTFRLKNPTEYHEYAFEWEENEMRWYIDGELRFKTNRGIYQEPMYLIMNLAVGGNWPGRPDENTPFPSALVVDYVRLYTLTTK